MEETATLSRLWLQLCIKNLNLHKTDKKFSRGSFATAGEEKNIFDYVEVSWLDFFQNKTMKHNFFL